MTLALMFRKKDVVVKKDNETNGSESSSSPSTINVPEGSGVAGRAGAMKGSGRAHSSSLSSSGSSLPGTLSSVGSVQRPNFELKKDEKYSTWFRGSISSNSSKLSSSSSIYYLKEPQTSASTKNANEQSEKQSASRSNSVVSSSSKSAKKQ